MHNGRRSTISQLFQIFELFDFACAFVLIVQPSICDVDNFWFQANLTGLVNYFVLSSICRMVNAMYYFYYGVISLVHLNLCKS